ncbi:MAG: AMP-binding protein [Terriglobales bacterium]|jgi:long-chain acyl-CoA synthetase
MPTFYQRFQECARKFPDNIALEIQRQQTVERVTFAELTRMSESVARWLSTRVPWDARVAILAANHPRWVAAYLGIIAAGRTAVPLDTAFQADQVKKLLIDSGASLLFCDVKHLPVATEAVEGIRVGLVMTSAAAEQVATTPTTVNPTQSMERDERGNQILRITESFAGDLDSIIAAGPADFQPIVPAESDLAALLYTSGTTADPKGVMLTHANLVGEANSVLATMKIGPEDALLGILPMFHVLAQMANLFLPLFNGARVVYLETLNTTELLRALQERNITAFCVVPQFFYLIHEKIFKELNKHGKITLRLVRTLMALNRALRRVGVNAGKLFFGKIHATFGARMRYLVTGGSRFDPAIARDFYSFGIDVLNAYGLTETSGGAFINPPGQRIVFGSVGKPFPGVEARIVEEKTVDPQPVEEGAPPVGDIAIRGALVMKGYWNRPEATAEVLRDGWLYTGDLGYFDSGGNLFITGRRKEIIVLANGKNVYPEEIEVHYLQTPFVKEICVMAVEARPGDPTSERLHAVVVPNFELLRERKIVNSKEVIRIDIEALSHKIASTKRLGSYDIWQEDLPRTTTRKLKRFQIEKKVRELQQKPGAGDLKVGVENAKPLTDDEQSWLERDDVKRALTVVQESVRESSRNQFPAIHPTHNLELDLGFDSMQRIELLTALEQQFGGEVPESQLAELYSVRDLVDAVLSSASRGEGQARAAAPAWSTILSEPVTDPEVLALARHNIFAEVFFFLLGRLIYLFALDRFHLKTRGLENLPEKGPFLLCSNHQSYIDPLVMAGALPWSLFRDTYALGTSDIFGEGFMRRLARWLRVVVLDPDANLVPAMRAGAFGLSQGHILVLYPEGERTDDGSPRLFRKGAAILSIHTQAPIVPIAIEGFYEAWPRHKKFPTFPNPKSTGLQLVFGKPIQPPPVNEASEAAYERLTSELKSRVVTMWQELRKEELREKELPEKDSPMPQENSKGAALANTP